MPRQPAADALSAAAARRLALAAQGLGRRRPARVRRSDVLGAVDRVGALQLDAINVVERTQFLTLFARVGAYDVSVVHDAVRPFGRLYETPGFLAELVPMERQPLFRPEIPRAHSTETPARRRQLREYVEAHRDYIDAVRKEVEARGPLAASELGDPRPRVGTWWGRRSDGRRALEFLFRRGDLSAWRSASFERIYDLTERVVPPEVLARPTPPLDDAYRLLLLDAARCLGVGTAGDLAAYHLLGPTRARPRLHELVEAGRLLPVDVEGWSEPGYVLPDARPGRWLRGHATLLPPFDPLRRGNRDRLRRVFGFDHRIEVYVPAPQRRFGYYVLPVLLGDELVGRLDLKADRAGRVLRVLGGWAEPGRSPTELAAAVEGELDDLRSWLGLADVAVVPQGDLGAALAT